MEDNTAAWRAALQAKGRHWVASELRMRPGQPGDTLYDVVHTPPFPTRDFCRQWCVEDDNDFLRMSLSTKAAFGALFFFMLFLAMAVHGWNHAKSARPAGGSIGQTSADQGSRGSQR